MKKPFIFLSDFDGTMSRVDFYHLFIDTPRMQELDKELRRRFIKREITSFDYLNTFLNELDCSERELADAINTMPMDPHVPPLVDSINRYDGDFAVISAGADYYIEPILSRIGLDVPLYSNRGYYENRGITMRFPHDETFHSPIYGIAKESVVEHLEHKYEKVLFAGDGSADFKAACAADVRFAKARLAERLTEAGFDFIPFETFADITDYCERELFPSLDEEPDEDIYGTTVEW